MKHTRWECNNYRKYLIVVRKLHLLYRMLWTTESSDEKSGDVERIRVTRVQYGSSTSVSSRWKNLFAQKGGWFLERLNVSNVHLFSDVPIECFNQTFKDPALLTSFRISFQLLVYTHGFLRIYVVYECRRSTSTT